MSIPTTLEGDTNLVMFCVQQIKHFGDVSKIYFIPVNTII